MRNSCPTRKDWDKNQHWREIHTYLYDKMNGVCVFCSSYTPRRRNRVSVDNTSIDHFVPKSRDHALAYEWSNFRLCRARLNNRKADFQDVLDPYVLRPRRFRLNLITFELDPGPGCVTSTDEQQVRDTLKRLELNTDDAYVNERARVVFSYADGKLPRSEIEMRYPFIAFELVDQDFDSQHLPRFQAALSNPKLRGPLIRQGWAS